MGVLYLCNACLVCFCPFDILARLVTACSIVEGVDVVCLFIPSIQ